MITGNKGWAFHDLFNVIITSICIALIVSIKFKLIAIIFIIASLFIGYKLKFSKEQNLIEFWMVYTLILSWFFCSFILFLLLLFVLDH